MVSVMRAIEYRNKQLYLRFCEELGKRPLMQIYSELGEEFYLSEERARKIVSGQRQTSGQNDQQRGP